jgi:hypothetical protein
MKRRDLAWEIDVPIISNPLVMKQLLLVFVLAPLLPAALLALAFWSQGDMSPLPAISGLLFALSAGLFLLAVVSSLLIYRNRMRYRFTLSPVGFESAVVDARARRVGWLTTGLGLLLGKAGVAGSGLLALSTERRSGTWKSVAAVRIHSAQRAIALRNDWRTVAVIYCTEDNFAAAKSFIASSVTDRPARRKTLWSALLWTALVILASLPAFAAQSPFGTSLMAAMILVSFAVATVWLIPPLAYVVIAATLWVLVEVAANAFAMRTSQFAGHPDFPAYEIANGDDWARLFMLVAGLAFLVWFSVRTLRGGFVPVLHGDENGGSA